MRRQTNPIVGQIPNLITLANLICGGVGILYIFKYPDTPTIYFVLWGCLFDFLDGLAARVLKAQSDIGKSLDSLADIVSFGLLPSIMLYEIIAKQTSNVTLPYLAFAVVFFSAYRLAKFNNDTEQEYTFTGLPTPANALFLAGLPMISGMVGGWINDPHALLVIVGIFSLLLVSPIKFFSLKMKNFSIKDNLTKYIFVIVSGIILLFLGTAGISLVILLYVLYCFFTWT
jgi:CDP-diacylglycerol--serine O-phosphatidyltransferase